MMELYCRPLSAWPREFTKSRRTSPFRSTFQATMKKLRYELGQLNAKAVVVQTAFAEREISVTTGWPPVGAKPAHPGVIIAADTKHGALKWVCDECTEWTANVHAIVLTLERLRLADLYGVTRRGEQYAGWRMLPGPISASAGAAPTMSIEQAARFVAGMSNADASRLISSRAQWEAAYRRAVKLCHPDKGVPTDGRWNQLQEAAQILNGLHSKK